jgi:hypothetical protein
VIIASSKASARPWKRLCNPAGHRWQTFANVTWLLMRPGLANAFLIGFVEACRLRQSPGAGGNYDVLSTDIFFAIVGSQNDQAGPQHFQSLLSLTLSAFTPEALAGAALHDNFRKGDSGLRQSFPMGVRRLIYLTAVHGSSSRFCSTDHSHRRLCQIALRHNTDHPALRYGLRR